MILMESLRDLEAQFQEEIDELQGKIERSKMMHEEEMETIVKNRVMTYLRGGTRDETENMLVGRGEDAKGMGSHDPRNFRETRLDIESIVRERVEAELKKKAEAEHAEIAELKKKVEAERVEAELKKKIEVAENREGESNLWNEMRLVESRNRSMESIRTPRTPDRECRHHNEDDGIREEIRRLRQEIKMSQLPSPVLESVVEKVDERDDLLERSHRDVRFMTPGIRTILPAHSHEAMVEDRRDDIQRMYGATSLFVSPVGPSPFSREAEDIDIRRNQTSLRRERMHLAPPPRR